MLEARNLTLAGRLDDVSAMLREFATPLLYIDGSGPADIDTLRTTIMLAMICWNVPNRPSVRRPSRAART